MSFLAIIIALALVQVWGSGGPAHHDSWFRGWQARVGRWGLAPALELAALVLLPVLLAQFVLNVLESLLFGLLWIGAACGLLLYSFGRGDFQALQQRYRSQCHSGDFEAAYLTACTEFSWEPEEDGPVSPAQVHVMVQRQLLYEGFQRWFAVIFYFLALGPAGALAYRLLHLAQDHSGSALVKQCLFLADWVPARLLAASFAITGDFVGSLDQLMAVLRQGSLPAQEVLYRVAEPALGVDAFGLQEEESVFGEYASTQNREYVSLLSRCAVGWIAVIALTVLFG